MSRPWPRRAKADLDAAVEAARAALAGPWGSMSARERGRLVSRLADRLMEKADHVARLETLHNGKPIAESRQIEIPAAAECFEYFAGWADKVMGDTIPVKGNHLTYTLREPIGVVAAIVPRNCPLLLAAWKVAPAMKRSRRRTTPRMGWRPGSGRATSRKPTHCAASPGGTVWVNTHNVYDTAAPSDDRLLSWRQEFPIVDSCTYLVSHSLGAMPRRAAAHLQEFAHTWSTRGVRAWHEGWWEIGRATGDLLAPILGVPKGTVSMHQNVTVAMAIVASCYRYDGARRTIVLTDLEFPSNMYLFEGLRRYGADVVYVPSDDGIRPNLDRLLAAIDERAVLVPVSLVLFKSSYVQNARAIVERAHKVGAHVILDVYQAAGTVPLNIEALGADYAVGGSVKWLCGGPGAGYLYVRPDLARTLEPAMAGWAAHARPFEFQIGAIEYAAAPERFQSGTPNVPALYSARGGYEIVAEIGVDAIRAKSLQLTRRLIERAQAAGYRVNTPLDDAERGGAVIVDVPDGAAVTDELIRRNVIVDYRPGAGIRMAPHFYNTAAEIDHAMDVLGEITARQ